MILTINKNLFEDVDTTFNPDKTPTIIAHGCNAQGKMRSGFAKAVRELDEGVFTAYKNSGHKLGTVSYFELYPKVYVANCVTQEFFGYDGKKYTSYDAIDSCFKEIDEFIEVLYSTYGERVRLLFPKIGAVLGGGNIDIINNIIDVNVRDFMSAKQQYVI